MALRIIPVSPIALPESSPELRVPPSKAIEASQMDYKTLAHDVFSSNGKTVLSGPRLFDLKGFLKGKFYIDGIDVSRKIRASEYSRHHRIHILHSGRELSISAFGHQWNLPINPDCNQIFAGKRVAFTLSKNNSLTWIRDWIIYYAVNHGVDGVLIYDNNSDAYTISEMTTALSDIKGVEIVIVPWNFKYGHARRASGGLITRFAFCQRGAWENAHFRFLSKAAWVIDPDIDELLVMKGTSIEKELASHRRSIGLSFETRNVKPITWSSDSQEKSFPDYFHFEKGERRGKPKWVLVPERISRKNSWLRAFLPEVVWEHHRIQGLKKIHNSESCYFAHFTHLTTGWKHSSRLIKQTYDPQKHVFDQSLMDHLLKAFPEKMKAAITQFQTAVQIEPVRD
ncbi:glycosyltransferase family 92 protein [Hylemonella sp. W303a]|uniref:glycosyltransferase family 92 protein n=1 Tax=Hylemonella sp. W303a TaxID=3389873 RepID=UPI00396B1846